MVSDSIHRDDICKISKLQDQERDSEWCACESWGIIFGAASSIRAWKYHHYLRRHKPEPKFRKIEREKVQQEWKDLER